jgi:hypothetical protein
MPHCHVMQEESDCRTQSGTGSSSVQSGTYSFGLRLAGSAPWTRADSWRRRAWRRRRFLAKAERFPRACHLGCACSSMKTANQRSRCGGGVCRLAGGLTSGFGRRASGVGGSRLKMSARSRAGDLEGIERSCGRRRYDGMACHGPARAAIAGTHGWRQGGCGPERARVRIIRYL